MIIGLDEIYGYDVSDCALGLGTNEISIRGSMLTMLNLDDDGLESGIYHTFDAVYYK